MLLKQLCILVLFPFLLQANSQNFAKDLQKQFDQSVYWLSYNIFQTNIVSGAIPAALSTERPNYFYHWVRDAALTVETLYLLEAALSEDDQLKTDLQNFFLDHIYFNQALQRSAKKFGGLGEPKFYLDASSYLEPWGRPQNDGPALRASSMIYLYHLIEDQNWQHKERLLSHLYKAELPANSVIKMDLEYVAHHWQDANFDLWEEVHGYHFYTLMAQRKALLLGADLAAKLDDKGASHFYLMQANHINAALEKFWHPDKGYIQATLTEGYKSRGKSHLDSAVILSVLHSDLSDLSFSFTDTRLLATHEKLRNAFAFYPINQQGPGSAIGRYPEDRYDGYQTDADGNPWVLTTAGFAEFLYRLAYAIATDSDFQINQKNQFFFSKYFSKNIHRISKSQLTKSLISDADNYLKRILYHGVADGSLSEQFNRYTGHMQGAENLTWSHASLITAVLAREKAYSVIKK